MIITISQHNKRDFLQFAFTCKSKGEISAILCPKPTSQISQFQATNPIFTLLNPIRQNQRLIKNRWSNESSLKKYEIQTSLIHAKQFKNGILIWNSDLVTKGNKYPWTFRRVWLSRESGLGGVSLLLLLLIIFIIQNPTPSPPLSVYLSALAETLTPTSLQI